MEQIKVLAFDTGGTVLDWHAGLMAAMTAWGAAHDIERDWHALANDPCRVTNSAQFGGTAARRGLLNLNSLAAGLAASASCRWAHRSRLRQHAASCLMTG